MHAWIHELLTVADPTLEHADSKLLAVIDRDFQTAAARAGEWLKCAPGCCNCCHGPFPITWLDRWRLKRGLALLQASDPQRAQEVWSRAKRAAAEMIRDFPGEVATGRLSPDEAALDGYFEDHAQKPCPALDTATGRCDLYEWRPISCRTYGPPVRFGDERAPACGLCFQGASTEVVEACRIEPDAQGLEHAALESMGPSADWETVVAFALSLG